MYSSRSELICTAILQSGFDFLDADTAMDCTAIREGLDLAKARLGVSKRGEKQVPVSFSLPAPARKVGLLRAKSHEPKISAQCMFNNPADSVLLLGNICIERT